MATRWYWAKKPVEQIEKIIPKHKLLRFCIVGGVAGILSLALLYILTDIAGMHYLISGVLSWLIASFLAYQGNSHFTFKKFPGFKGFGKFISSRAGTTACGFGIFVLLTTLGNIWYIFSSVISTVTITMGNFLIAKFWIWK